MDKYEVTNIAYARCVNSNICQEPASDGSYIRPSYYGDSKFDNYPVIHVNWEMANKYCEWRGARLPTEAEWEKSARGPNGSLYPWGNTFDGTRSNSCDTNCPAYENMVDYNDGHSDTAPVDAYPSGVSVYGVFNLSGNVLEWVADRYDANYYLNSPSNNPLGPTSGDYRVCRGGAWGDDSDSLLASNRIWEDPSSSDLDLGFRCAISD